jgi:hypothetical protein
MTEFSINDLQEKLWKYGTKAVEAEEAMLEAGEELQVLEDIKQTRLAQFKTDASGKSDAEKERNARISTDWITWLDILHDKRVAYNKAKLEYHKYDRYFELSRSLLSVKKSELNQLNIGERQ